MKVTSTKIITNAPNVVRQNKKQRPPAEKWEAAEIGEKQKNRNNASCHSSADVGRILRTFKIKKNDEVTGTGTL